MTIKKFGYMVKGIENPLTNLIAMAIEYERGDNKSHYLVKTKRCTSSELDDFINRANVAWESACEWVYASTNKPIEFEISTTVQEFSRWRETLPYIQIKCGKSFFRIGIPKEADGLKSLQKKFGDFYAIDDIRPIVNGWLNRDYTVSIEPAEVAETVTIPNEEEEVMTIQQETDLFVVSEGKVWSVDTGECLQENSKPAKVEPVKTEQAKVEQSYVFHYKRCDYHNSYFEFIFTADEVLVVEYLQDEFELVNVECVQYCLIECIRTGWLKKLEKLYRDGRSNLPDAVFDHIMEVQGMTEERLQALCGGVAKSEWHYNSYGVQSSKCDPSVKFGEHYPADSKILSQDKVRDPQKLADIVRSWNGKAVVSWKLDGAAVRLHYKGQNLVCAESKGKARDVTELMRGISGIPKVVYHGYPFIEDWFKDKDWFVTGELVAVNGRRSVAAGYLLRKDPDSDETTEIANRLQFVVYDSNICEYPSKNPAVSPIRLYSQMINLLKTEAYFNVVELCEFKSAEQISDEDILEDLQVPQEFDTDGLVVRVNDIKKYVSMGETAHHPKGSVAFKFEDEWKRVKPDCIYGKRGTNGVLKIIAEFRPLRFGDKTVKSAVWQPKNIGFSLEYNSSLRNKGGGDSYEVFCYEQFEKVKFTDHFNVSEIEVCLRGHVIPQWRLIEQ